MSTLARLLSAKTSQWAAEATIAAGRAVQQNRVPQLIVYPSGKRMMRFAEPFAEFGMHFEVTPETWDDVHSCDGFVVLAN
jgi:hypothetical protein